MNIGTIHELTESFQQKRINLEYSGICIFNVYFPLELEGATSTLLKTKKTMQKLEIWPENQNPVQYIWPVQPLPSPAGQQLGTPKIFLINSVSVLTVIGRRKDHLIFGSAGCSILLDAFSVI